MVVIINVSTGSKEIGVVAGIAIGAVVLLEAMFAGPITNASMNPARSLAPNIVSGNIVVSTGVIEEFNVVVGIGKNYPTPFHIFGQRAIL